MYIRPNAIMHGMMFFSVFTSNAFDIIADVDMGMQTNRHQLVMYKGNKPSLSVVEAKHRIALSDSIGYQLPEFLDLSLAADFNVIDNVFVRPYVDVAFVNMRADVGAIVQYRKDIGNQGLSVAGFVDAYHSMYYDNISFDDCLHYDVDLGLNMTVNVNEYVSMFATVQQPLRFEHLMTYDLSQDRGNGVTNGAHNARAIQVSNNSWLGIGVKLHLMSDFGDLLEDQPLIIQEPISIPVLEVVDESEEPVFLEMPTVDTSDMVIEEEEPMGWFEWIIEFFAKLFRF